MLREVSERDNQKVESTVNAFQGITKFENYCTKKMSFRILMVNSGKSSELLFHLNMFLHNGLLGVTREGLIYRSLQLIADGGGVSKLT